MSDNANRYKESMLSACASEDRKALTYISKCELMESNTYQIVEHIYSGMPVMFIRWQSPDHIACARLACICGVASAA